MELVLSLVLLGVAASIWYVFLRPVTAHKGCGQILEILHKPAGKFWQYQPSGTQRGFNTPTAIATSEGYILIIRIEGLAPLGKALVSSLEKDTYRVGDRVSLEYALRGVSGVWTRPVVFNLTPVPRDCQ